MQGSHGLKNKCLPHEESAGIPLITYLPGAPSGRVTDGLVSMIDLVPTCLDIAGITPPATMDGRSIAPYLRGESAATCDRIFSERSGWCMIVRDGWKLVAERRDNGLAPTTLIHLDDDPWELRNRVEDPASSVIHDQLFAELRSWNDQVTSHRPDQHIAVGP